MKKIFSILFALFITILAFAYDCYYNGIYYDIDDINKTAIVTHDGNPNTSNSYCGYLGKSYSIPSAITPFGGNQKYVVIAIADSAFYRAIQMVSVTIPNSITSIGNSAFYGCKITSITIPNSVTSIGSRAFEYCTGLKSVKIPNSVTSIDDYAFQECTGLTSLEIGTGVTSLGYRAFSRCTGLASVYISDISAWCNFEFELGSNPLYYAENLYLNNEKVTDLVIPEGVDSIKSYVFHNCLSLTSITIPNSVISIGVSAFSYCTNLKSATVSNGVTSIANGTFSNCTGLTSITIPNGVKSIGDYAFNGCFNLASVTIPNTVTYIGDYAFGGCGIKDLYVTAKSIEDYCNSSVYEAMLYEHKGLLERKRHLVINGFEITDLVIPETIKTINNNTFMDFSCIAEIIIPNSVTSIEGTAFLRCTGLKSVKFGNAITSIGKSAFSDCSSLASIEIPNSVTSIGEGAFEGCTGLNSVKLGKGITSIGRCVFYDCTKLDTIICFATIPADVNGETFVLQYSYNNTKSHYDDCLLLVPESSLGAYKNHEIWGKFKNIRGFKEKYTISTSVNDEMMGAVSEGGVYEEDSEIILTAIAKEGYGFVKWSDGNTENPRKVVVSQDSTFAAIFGKLYTIATSANDERMGIVLGSGEYGEGSEIILIASANEGYHFVQWSDGNTENPRTIVVTENVYLTAEFGLDGIQTPVKDVNKSSVMIYVRDKMIHIEGITEDYQIFDAFGRLVYTGRESALSLPRGVYVVVVEGEVEKVVL